MGVKACDRCGLQMIFAKSATTGRWMPVDDEASPTGNVRLELESEPPIAHVLAGQRLEQSRAAGEKLHVSHFVTCPGAEEFRRR